MKLESRDSHFVRGQVARGPWAEQALGQRRERSVLGLALVAKMVLARQRDMTTTGAEIGTTLNADRLGTMVAASNVRCERTWSELGQESRDTLLAGESAGSSAEERPVLPVGCVAAVEEASVEKASVEKAAVGEIAV